MSKPSRKHAGICAFCGGRNLSKEHFWPQWASALIQHTLAGPNRQEFIVRTQKTEVVSHTLVERQGSVTNKTIRVVCRACNNGWMSAVETSSRPLIEPLIIGRPCALTEIMQTQLAEWITLRVMVGEQNKKALVEAVFTQADREAFRKSRRIPESVTIWIARCVGPTWRSAYLRHSAALALPGTPKPTALRNVQTTAFGIGQLFAFTAVCAADGIDLPSFFRLSPAFARIWPVSIHRTPWPLAPSLTDASAHATATLLDQLMRSPNVLWNAV